MNRLQYIALMTLVNYGQSAAAMETPTPNYCHDAIEEIKQAPVCDTVSLLNILKIEYDDDDQAFYENRGRIEFIAEKIKCSKGVNQEKKTALKWFVHIVNQKANAYSEANENTAGETKEYKIKRLQVQINETITKYAHKNYLPMKASPAIAIQSKKACIDRLRAASTDDLRWSYCNLLKTFFDIEVDLPKTSPDQEDNPRRLDSDIDREVYNKREDINDILDAVRVNPMLNQ